MYLFNDTKWHEHIINFLTVHRISFLTDHYITSLTTQKDQPRWSYIISQCNIEALSTLVISACVRRQILDTYFSLLSSYCLQKESCNTIRWLIDQAVNRKLTFLIICWYLKSFFIQIPTWTFFFFFVPRIKENAAFLCFVFVNLISFGSQTINRT